LLLLLGLVALPLLIAHARPPSCETSLGETRSLAAIIAPLRSRFQP
jgi:hypothetical protein